MVILTLLAYGLWKERQKEEAAKKDQEVSDILDNLESSGEEEEKDAEIEDIEKALAELKESELGNVSQEQTAPTSRKADIFDDNAEDGRNVESDLYPIPGEALPERRNKSRSRSITGLSSATKPESRSRTRSRSRGTSRTRERSRGGKKVGGRRSVNIADRSKIEMVKLKIERRIQREEDEKRLRREEERRRMREGEEFHQPRHSNHHHRHFTNPDHYPRYDEDEYYGPPGPPPPFHGAFHGPVSAPYPRQHNKAGGGGGYCQERGGGGGHHEKDFHAKTFHPPPLPPALHMHYQRFPAQYY